MADLYHMFLLLLVHLSRYISVVFTLALIPQTEVSICYALSRSLQYWLHTSISAIYRYSTT